MTAAAATLIRFPFTRIVCPTNCILISFTNNLLGVSFRLTFVIVSYHMGIEIGIGIGTFIISLSASEFCEIEFFWQLTGTRFHKTLSHHRVLTTTIVALHGSTLQALPMLLISAGAEAE